MVPYAATSVLSALLGVATLVVLTRLLPPAAYGAYAVILTAATLGQSACFQWLQAGVLRFHPGAAGAAGLARLGRAVRAGYLLSAGGAALACVAAALVARPDALAAAAGLAMVLARGWVGVVQAWNRSAARPWRFVAVEAVSGVGALVLAVAGLRARPGDPAMPLLAAAAAALVAFALWPRAERTAAAGPAPAHPRPRLAELWAYGAPLAFVSLVSVILAASDRLLIAALLGTTAAGAYSVAAVIADRSVGLLLLSVTLATKPLVFAAYERGGDAAAHGLLARVAAWVMAAGFPAATLLVFAPLPVARLLVGGGMAPQAALVLPWLGVGALCSGLLALHFALAFQIARRTTWMLAAVAPAAILNLLANLVLLPRHGVIAAGWTTLGSYMVATLLAVWLGRRHFVVPFPGGDALRTAAACVPLALFARLAASATLPQAALALGGSALVYAASAYALDVAGLRTALALRR